MLFKDQIDFVRQHIKRNRLRVFMTILAATMGTAFLIVLASVGFGIHDTLRSEMLSNRLVNEIYVYPEAEEADIVKDIEKFKKLEHVKAVINQQGVTAGERITVDDFLGHARMNVTDFSEEAKVGFELSEGRLPENAGEIIVGSHFSEFLYKEDGTDSDKYEGKIIGKEILYSFEENGEVLEQIPLTIVGIGKNPSKEWVYDSSIMADASIIPQLEKLYNELEHKEENLFYNEVNVYADKIENVSKVATEIREKGYYTYSIADELKQIDVFFLALKAGLIFVGTIAILISSIGIFNTMTMAVTERTREIGVMKAIGANPKLIQRLFVMESAWIGIVGTVIAVILSYGVSMIANYVLPIIVFAALDAEEPVDFEIVFSVIPWQLIVIASIISISVAVISGWRPARKATKIDVIQALRQEL